MQPIKLFRTGICVLWGTWWFHLSCHYTFLVLYRLCKHSFFVSPICCPAKLQPKLIQAKELFSKNFDLLPKILFWLAGGGKTTLDDTSFRSFLIFGPRTSIDSNFKEFLVLLSLLVSFLGLPFSLIIANIWLQLFPFSTTISIKKFISSWRYFCSHIPPWSN